MTPIEQAQWNDDHRPALYATLYILLLLNNLVTAGRLVANYIVYYHDGRGLFRRIFIEDYFILLSAICVYIVIANLFQSTRDGLGLHSWRINHEDTHYPIKLSNTLKHVWIVMVLNGPTFTFVKLCLLFFHRRLFLINQKWFKWAWWTNLIHVLLWLTGATGFYMRYYEKFHVGPPYPIKGQCNATTTVHVSIPIVFGLASDIAILTLPVITILHLHAARKTRLGLTGIFSVGVLACTLDLARIIELTTDTDDKNDPSC